MFFDLIGTSCQIRQYGNVLRDWLLFGCLCFSGHWSRSVICSMPLHKLFPLLCICVSLLVQLNYVQPQRTVNKQQMSGTMHFSRIAYWQRNPFQNCFGFRVEIKQNLKNIASVQNLVRVCSVWHQYRTVSCFGHPHKRRTPTFGPLSGTKAFLNQWKLFPW